MRSKFILVRFVCADSSLHWLSVSSDKGCSLSGTGEERASTSTKGNLCPAFKPNEKKLLVCLLLLNCLQQKTIILGPKRYILEWHVLFKIIEHY